MTLTKYERENTWKTQVQFVSGSTYVDPSGNLSTLTIYDPNDNVLSGYNNVSGIRTGLGTFKYYVTVPATSDLGIYRCKWDGYFNYQTPWDFKVKIENEVVQIVHVIQT